jgi:hypothetical protein
MLLNCFTKQKTVSPTVKEDISLLEVLRFITENDLSPNVKTWTPATVKSVDFQSLRSTVTGSQLVQMVMISVEQEFAQVLHLKVLIQDLSALKARNMTF